MKMEEKYDSLMTQIDSLSLRFVSLFLVGMTRIIDQSQESSYQQLSGGRWQARRAPWRAFCDTFLVTSLAQSERRPRMLQSFLKFMVTLLKFYFYNTAFMIEIFSHLFAV